MEIDVLTKKIMNQEEIYDRNMFALSTDIERLKIEIETLEGALSLQDDTVTNERARNCLFNNYKFRTLILMEFLKK